MGRFRWLTLYLCRDWKTWRTAVSHSSRRVSGYSSASQSHAEDVHTLSSRLTVLFLQPFHLAFTSSQICKEMQNSFPLSLEHLLLWTHLLLPFFSISWPSFMWWDTSKTYPTTVLVSHCGPRNSEIVLNSLSFFQSMDSHGLLCWH